MFLKVFKPYPIVSNVGNGSAILADAINIHISSEINGMYSLEFDLPINSHNLKYLNYSDYWIDADNKWYFIIGMSQDKSSHLIHVICRHIIALSSINNKIEIFPIMVGVDAKTILNKAIELIPDCYFSLLTDEELPDGMEWVDDLTDVVDGWDLVSLYDVVSNILQLLGYGELYFKNNKFAIVKRIGEDKNVLFTPSRNVENIKIDVNSNEIMNEILVLGENDMPLDVDTYPGSIIRSEDSIRRYGIRKGTLKINTQDKSELERKALWEISSLNPERVDMPKIIIDVSAVDVGDKLDLGDGIRIKDNELEIDEIKRIVAMEYWPNEPKNNKYTIGDRALTLEQLLAKLEMTRETLSKNINTSGEITPDGIAQLSPYLQNSKNFVFNSSFEIYEDEIPIYWDCFNGSKISKDSQNYDSTSLLVPPGGYAIQSESAAIPVSYYESESNSTMVFMSHKWGACKVSIIDADGNPVPHTTKYDVEKVNETTFPYDVYYRNFLVLTFLHEDISSEEKKYRIKIENADDKNCYIDGVMATPNKNGVIPLYRDGAFSQGTYSGKDSKNEDNFVGSSDYTDNITYYNLEDGDISINSVETSVLSTRLYKKDLDTRYYNINIQTSLILSDIQSDIYMDVKLNGSTEYTVIKKYIADEDIFTFTKTLSLPISTIGEETGTLLEVVCNGIFTVEEGSSLTCILSKNTAERTTLLKIDKMGTGTNGVLTDDIIGEIYQDEKGRIIMDVQCINTSKINYTSSFLTTTEEQTIWDSVEVVNFYKSPESYFSGFRNTGFFTSHPTLKEVNGLSCFANDETYISMKNTFSECTNLKKISSLPIHVSDYSSTFKNCIHLKSLPTISGLLNVGGGSVNLSYMCQGCTSLEKVPLNVYQENLGGSVSTLAYAFDGCINLKSVSGVIRGNANVGAISSQAQYAFRNCAKLTGNLFMTRQWGTPTSSGTDYSSRVEGCFEGCSTDESASLKLYSPDSGGVLISTKSENSNITLG